MVFSLIGKLFFSFVYSIEPCCTRGTIGSIYFIER